MSKFISSTNRNSWLCTAAVLLFLSRTLLAAPAQLKFDNVTTMAGATVTDNGTFTPGDTPLTGVSFDLAFDPTVFAMSCAIGPAGTAAGKTIFFNNPSQGDLRCGVIGYNQTAIGSGVLVILTINVSSAAPPGVYTIKAVGPSGTDAGGNTQTLIIPDFTVAVGTVNPPKLSVSKTHVGDFTQGQTGATYTVVVSNSGTGPTTAPVTVTDSPSSGLTLVSMSGNGWTCTGNTCARSDVLQAGASFPALTAAVNVAAKATSPQVNTATVSGGGSANATASDPTNIPPTPASITPMPGSTPQSTLINTPFPNPLAAIVKDGNGNPMSGVTVTYSAANCTLSGGNTGVTDANGIVSKICTANGTGGSYTVTASAGNNVQTTFSLTNTLPPPVITATCGTPQATTVNTAFPNSLCATVTQNGNPLPNQTVTFTPPNKGPSCSIAPGGNTALTDSNGVATSGICTANTLAGSYSVQATVNGANGPAIFSLTNKPDVPASITAVSGTPQSANINSVFTSPFVAAVKDQYGNSEGAGIAVTFCAPPAGNGASGSFSGVNCATVNTDTTGTATSPLFTPNGTGGGYSVNATAGKIGPAVFSLMNVAGPMIVLPTSVTLIPGAQVTFPVALSQSSATGPELIGLSVANPTIVSITNDSVLIPQGETTSNRVKLIGLQFGCTTITGSAPGYASTTVAVQVTMAVTTTSLLSGQVGKAYSQTLAAAGGTLPYTWSAISGTLPAGLILNSATGEIAGTPTAAGVSNLTFQVTDSSNPTLTATAALSLAIAPQNGPAVLLPGGVTVGAGKQTSFIVALSAPSQSAPVTINLSSSDPSAAFVSPSLVVMPPGETVSARVVLQGIAPGQVTITGTADGYSPSTVDVQVTP